MTHPRWSARRFGQSAAAIGAVLLATLLIAQPASASTSTGPGSARAAAVQAVLDRVLGPGNAVVVVSDTIQSSTGTSSSVRWGTGVAASAASSTLTVQGAGASVASTQQNLVGTTVTTTVTPAGALVRQTVSIVVNRTQLGSVSIAALRRMATAAADIRPARGDRLSLVAAVFAKAAAPAVAPAVTPLTVLQANGVPLIEIAGAVIALTIVLALLRGRRRPASRKLHVGTPGVRTF